MRPRGARGTHHRVRIGVLDVVGDHADRIEDLERLGWRHDARARGRTAARRPERLTRGEEAARRIRPIRGRRNPDRLVISRDRRKSPQFQNTTTPPRASTSGDDRRNQPGGLRSVSSASLSVFHSNRVVVVASSREGRARARSNRRPGCACESSATRRESPSSRAPLDVKDPDDQTNIFLLLQVLSKSNSESRLSYRFRALT